ncbi:phosphoserine phosphatase serb [Fragilariopsis cylindrus CCMP1102]|uniref:phosphoserine phosphatase n=1 Tax=Fragilariopsis cylindrus CCMP1102 TaxID=635003 RepID=A0A1E7F9F9_9STRA|nr:phosphoserine phosphatase serb [Fragilariopsis cylindrus CCMP1102]|eukprot:OEU14473.1 phosphoserine phosphatase serb [Fragilariopsis cylindrus CCMP1102]
MGQVYIIFVMIAAAAMSTRSAITRTVTANKSAFVSLSSTRLVSTTRTTTARAFSSWYQNNLSTSRPTTMAKRPTSFITQRRTFFTEMMRMISGSSEDENAETPESIMESFLEKTQNKDTVGNDVMEAMFALYEADAVCFDVDSTVINEEGIDVLAEFLGKGEEVAALTAAAMDGGMKFQDALAQRLDLLKPSRKQILDCLEKNPLLLTDGITKLISTLQSKNVDVYLVSGGFRIMIEPVAKILNINPSTHVIANTIVFDNDDDTGLYKGFDTAEPTSKDMGKPKAIQQILDNRFYNNGIVMIGDGATDAQAKPPATAFIGFGGVVVREAVKNSADWFVTNFDDMTTIIEMRKTIKK